MAETVAGAAEPKLGYRPGLDGLRGVAVALVVAVHFWPDGRLPGGFVGVDLFFVLSGYLITTLLVGELDRTGRVAVGDFLWRRAVRLVPALALVLAAVWILLDDPTTRAAVPLTFGYLANFAAASGDSLGGLQHAWSLAVEEQFYVVWVLAVPLVWRMRRPVAVLAVVIVAVTLWRTWLLAVSDDPVWFRFDTRVDGLLAGCALAFRPAWRPARWMILAAGVSVAWCVVAPMDLWVLYPLVTVASVVLVAAARDWNAGPVCQWVGRRSYGIYLWHYPAWIFCYFRLGLGADAWWLALPVTVAAAAVTYVVVELPLRQRLVVNASDRRPGDVRANGHRPAGGLVHLDAEEVAGNHVLVD